MALDAAAVADNDRGSATIAVMLFGVLAVVVGLSIASQFVTEYRAIEDSLAQTRAYWAGLGHATYVLSRTRQTGATTNNGASQNSIAAMEQSYLAEITTGSNSLQTWSYFDIGAAYGFTVQSIVCVDPLAPVLSSGEMLVNVSFSGPATCPSATGTPAPCPSRPAKAPATPEALRTLTAARLIEVRYCIVGNASDACGMNDLIKNTPAYSYVTSIHRPYC